jgi:hypothetical protein
MAKAGRRYRVGEHPIYDINFDRRKAGSAIFWPQRASTETTWIAAMLDDKAGLERLLEIWRGDKDGIYFDHGKKQTAILSNAERMLSDVEKQFEIEKQTAINKGRKPPKEMHPALDKKRLIAEANLDLVNGEIERLETLLKTATEKKVEEAKEKVLMHGPKGSGKMRGGILCELDFQKVEQDDKGILKINEPSSPYHGMLASAYFEQIVKPWADANAVLLAAHLEAVQSGAITDRTMKAPQAPWPERPKKEKSDDNPEK